MDGLAALNSLETVGYYRLLGYMRALQAVDPGTGVRRFLADTSMDDVLALYEFDRKLRLRCMGAVEHIEVALRSAVVSEIAVREGAHFYLDPNHFKHPALCTRFQDAVAKEAPHSRVIRHYQTRYSSPVMPPIWVAMEAVTFGALSHLYSNLKRRHRLRVANRFVLDEGVLGSWLRSVNGVRNICAHHGRLWNAPLHVDQPRPGNPFAAEFNPQPNTFFDRAVVMAVLLDRIGTDPGWKDRLVDLIGSSPAVDPARMGFPAAWRTRPFWSVQRKKTPHPARHIVPRRAR
ncbi:MAG TPA: Abi family protein [Longimicrobium sp.]|nr:Abi family protein [Longimicrobium sp.]